MLEKPKAIFDIECYKNYFLICFTSVDTGRRKHFELYDGHPLDRNAIVKIMKSYTLVGFNSNGYDVPQLRLALKEGTTNETLKKQSDAIIVMQMKPWDCEREFQLPKLPAWFDSIDLIEPAPSVMVSLKLYGGRLHSRKLQDLPIDPSAVITPEMRPKLVEYCYNDCDNTLDLYNHIKPQLELRAQMSDQYGVDLRSKSDAQIAEAVIRHELERISGDVLYRPTFPPSYTFQYVPPDFIQFKTQQLQDVLDTITGATFALKHTKAKDTDDDVVTVGGTKVKVSGIKMPDEIKGLRIKIGVSTYKLGIGGLHSTESSAVHHSTNKVIVKDADVASFYPAILINCGLFPEHLGKAFLDVYSNIRDRRLAAKKRVRELKEEIKELKMLIASVENDKGS